EPYRSRDQFGPYTVPPGQYFAMGDNRDRSSDSRYWGTVPRPMIKGRAFMVYWSFASTPPPPPPARQSSRRAAEGVGRSADPFLHPHPVGADVLHRRQQVSLHARTIARLRQRLQSMSDERIASSEQGTAVVVDRSDHPISRRQIPENVLKVLYRLHRSGYRAYLCGGSVRALLMMRTPKDFASATDAYPAAIRRLFRNSRIIGRRFRLA